MYIYIICKIVHVCADLGIVVGAGGGGGGGLGGAAWKSRHTTAAWVKWKKSSVDPEGGGGRGCAPVENHKLYGVL